MSIGGFSWNLNISYTFSKLQFFHTFNVLLFPLANPGVPSLWFSAIPLCTSDIPIYSNKSQAKNLRSDGFQKPIFSLRRLYLLIFLYFFSTLFS